MNFDSLEQTFHKRVNPNFKKKDETANYFHVLRTKYNMKTYPFILVMFFLVYPIDKLKKYQSDSTAWIQKILIVQGQTSAGSKISNGCFRYGINRREDVNFFAYTNLPQLRFGSYTKALKIGVVRY